MTYSNSNKYGSNKVNSDNFASNHVVAHQYESNHVRFDPINLTNINQISYSDFDFIHDVLSLGSNTSATRKQSFTYGTEFTNYPPPPSGEGSEGSSPEVSIKPLGNYMPINNPPSPVQNLPNDPDLDPDPKFSDYFSSDPSDLSDSRDVKQKNVNVINVGVKIVRPKLLKIMPILQTNY